MNFFGATSNKQIERVKKWFDMHNKTDVQIIDDFNNPQDDPEYINKLHLAYKEYKSNQPLKLTENLVRTVHELYIIDNFGDNPDFNLYAVKIDLKNGEILERSMQGWGDAGFIFK